MNLLKHPRVRAILDNPFFFNSVRWLLAGSQDVTRRLLVEQMALTETDRLLDVCCGTGDFAMPVPGWYVGLDLNERFVRFARHRYVGDAKKCFLVADATRASFAPGAFDKAFFLSSLHHFPDDQARLIMLEMARVTLGLVAITDLLADVPHPVKRFFALLDRGDYVRSLKAKRALLEETFIVEKCQVFESRLAVQALFICRPKTAHGQTKDG